MGRELLGFAADDRVTIVHADDLGMCSAANAGGFAALAQGPMTCGSVMVPCPAFDEAAELARADPTLDIGVHLTLNAEWETYRWGPVAGSREVPSLVDSEGFLHRSVGETLAAARPEEVEVELRAQIDAALAAGIDVTHLDVHMGTAFFPPLCEVYARLLRDYRLPGPLFKVEPGSLPAAFADVEASLRAVVDGLEADGFPLFAAIDSNSLHFEPGGGRAHNEARLDGLAPGITYLITHPAKDGAELSRIAPDAHCRAFECDYYGGPGGRAALDSRGIRTLGMRAVRDRLRAETA